MKYYYTLITATLIHTGIFAQITLSTYPTTIANNGTAGITFQLVAKNAITLKEIGSQVYSSGTSTYTLWYKIGGYTSAPTISTTNGWVQVGSGTSASGGGSTSAPVVFATGLNIILPKGTHGIHLTTSNVGYKTWASTSTDTFADANITIKTGTNHGYGGAAPSPTFHPRQFCGYVKYTLNATWPNDAGVDAITEPLLSCVGTYAIKARVKNFGKNKIDSVRVHWSLNAVPQTTYIHRSALDTIGGVGANTAIVTLGNITFVNNVPYSIVAWTEKPNNITDTVTNNDTADLNMTGRAYPIVNLGIDTSNCPGDTLYLNAGPGNDSVRWSTSANTQILKVTTSGTYSVKVYKWGCLSHDTIVTGLYPPAPSFSLGNDTTFCDGNSFLLNGPTGSGLTYEWQDSSINSSYLVDTSGTFKLTVSTTNGCKKSDSKLVKLFASPTVSITVKPSITLCYGKPILFTAVAKTDGSKLFQWKVNGLNSGPPTTSTTFAPVGLIYGDSVSVDLITDICASAPYPVPSNGIVMFINPRPILINGITADTVIENTKKSYAIGITTGHSYIWRASGGAILGDTTISAIQVQWAGPNDSAYVSLQETDATNCTYDNKLPVRVISIIGIDADGVMEIGNAWPNPADQSFRIQLRVSNPVSLQFTIHDITGKVVMESFNGLLEDDRLIEVSTAEMKDGIYFCKFRTSAGHELVKKLIVSH